MKFAKPVLKVLISAVLIAIVVQAFDVRGIGAHFAKVDAVSLGIAIGVALSMAPLHTLRWMAVLRTAGDTRLGFPAALQIVLIGHFFNQTLPSSVGGDAVRAWCAWRAGVRFATAAGTVIVDRGLTLVALLLLAACGLPWLFERIADPVPRWALSSVVFAGLAGFTAFIALVDLPRFLTRWRVVRAVLAVAALARRATFDPRAAITVIGLSAVSFIGFAYIVSRLAAAMQLPVTFADCVLLVPPVILVTIVPVSIAGWGVREGAMVVAFGFIGVPPSAAFAVSVLFGLTLAVASLPGSVLWLASGYKVKNVVAQSAVAGRDTG